MVAVALSNKQLSRPASEFRVPTFRLNCWMLLSTNLLLAGINETKKFVATRVRRNMTGIERTIMQLV